MITILAYLDNYILNNIRNMVKELILKFSSKA